MLSQVQSVLCLRLMVITSLCAKSSTVGALSVSHDHRFSICQVQLVFCLCLMIITCLSAKYSWCSVCVSRSSFAYLLSQAWSVLCLCLMIIICLFAVSGKPLKYCIKVICFTSVTHHSAYLLHEVCHNNRRSATGT